MKTKKKLSMFMAGVMMFSMTTPVFAALPGAGDITGEADIPTVTIPGPLLGGVVPTGIVLDFTIDPLGLLDLEEDDIFDDTNRTNAVRFDDDDETVLGAQNTSSVPMVITVNLSVDGGDYATVVSTEAAVTDDDEPNVLFWMEPTRNNLKTPAAEAPENFEGVGFVIPFGTVDTPASATYLLAEIPTQLRVTNDDPITLVREAVTENDLNGTAFSFGGIFNPDAEWTDDIDVSISVTFTVAQLHAAHGGIDDEDPYVVAGGAPVANLLVAGENLTASDSGAITPPTLIAIPVITSGSGNGNGGGGGGNVINASAGWFIIPNITGPVTAVEVGVAASWITGANIALDGTDLWVNLPTPGTHTLTIWGATTPITTVTVVLS